MRCDEDFWPYLHGHLPGPGVRFGWFAVHYASVHHGGDLRPSAHLRPVCRRAGSRKLGLNVMIFYDCLHDRIINAKKGTCTGSPFDQMHQDGDQ